MRKRNIKLKADTIIWSIIYLLPIICYIIYCFNYGRANNLGEMTLVEYRTGLSFGTFLSYTRFECLQSNIIFRTLYRMFGSNGSVFPLFNNEVLMIFAWFIGTHIVHLFVDILLFIPRWAHTMMHKFNED